MGTVAEREMLAGVLTPDVEDIRRLEFGRIMVRGADHDQDIRVGGDLDAAQDDRLERSTPPMNDGGVEAQDFFDRIRDQGGRSTDRLPAVPILEETPQTAGQQRCRGLVAGEQQSEEYGRDFLL